MSALWLIYALIFIAAIAFVSGFYILLGLGAALLALSVALISFVILLSRGLINDET